jgi:hypothetical protein
MGGLYALQLTQRVAGIAAHAGRWLMPWACVLVLSGAMANAAEQALVRILPDQSTPAGLPAVPDLSCDTRSGGPTTVGLNTRLSSEPQIKPCFEPLAGDGSRWVSVESIETSGSPTRVTCLTSADRVSTNVLYVRSQELGVVASQVCSQLWHSQDT